MDSYYNTLAEAGLTAWLADGVDARDENGCLLWPHGKFAAGYGCVYRESGEPEYVHRVAHEAVIGPIPDGYHVDHVWERGCRSRACFWPGHLEAVTPAENNRRRWLAFKMSHPRPCGHEWGNDRPGRSGDCKICHREQERARHQAKGPSKRVLRVRLIRELAKAGYEVAAIASQAQCSLSTVHRVLSGKTCASVS